MADHRGNAGAPNLPPSSSMMNAGYLPSGQQQQQQQQSHAQYHLPNLDDCSPGMYGQPAANYQQQHMQQMYAPPMHSPYLQNMQQQQQHQQPSGIDSIMTGMSLYGGGVQQAPPNPAMMSASGWNVNATEFVPRCAMQQNYMQHPNNNMYNGAQISPHAAMPEQPYNMPAYDSSWLGDPAMDPSVMQPGVIFSESVNRAMQGPAGPTLMEIQVGLEQLVKMPDEADTWQEAIVTRMVHPKVMDLDLMKVVSTMIFETASTYPSAAYTIANLLGHMCRHPQLAESFLMRCVLPHIRAENEQRFANHVNDVERLRQFAQLVAECFLRLTMRATTSRMEMLGAAVIEHADTLMSDLTNEDNVRCAALILKNCGKALDNDKPDQMDEVMDRIRAHVEKTDNGLNVEARKQLKNVLVLHDNHWGQPTRGSSSGVTGGLSQPRVAPAANASNETAKVVGNGSMDDDASKAYEQQLNKCQGGGQ